MASDRYDVIGAEWLFEPGSNEQVLKNKLGITDPLEMEKVETEHLLRARQSFQKTYSSTHQFTAADILNMHKIWLGPIYDVAGKCREVNISKDGFAFASAQHIPSLMKEFEEKHLAKYTPGKPGAIEEVAEALAVTHVELIVIHPFREGNGRTSRELANLLAAQSGLPILNYDLMMGDRKPAYISAINAGFVGDIKPLTNLFKNIIDYSLVHMRDKSFENIKWYSINNPGLLESAISSEGKIKTKKLLNDVEAAMNKSLLINSKKEKLSLYFGEKSATSLLLNDRMTPEMKVAAASLAFGWEISQFSGLNKNDLESVKSIGRSLRKDLGREL